MARVAVDIMGPFPCTKWNRYVLTAMDYFSKWPEAFAITDQEAEAIADAVVEGVFSRFGAAVTIHSDQGRNFKSQVFAAMCESAWECRKPAPLHSTPRATAWGRDSTGLWPNNSPF